MPPKLPPKSVKEQKKELEEKMFGQKNKKKNLQLKKQMEKLKTLETVSKKKDDKKDERKETVQKVPVGVDPKTEFPKTNCKFNHDISLEPKNEDQQVKLVCRFMLDAMNSGQYNSQWICPDKTCSDVHKLIDVDKENAEITLEEFLELSRQEIQENEKLIEETFMEWKKKKIEEQVEFEKKAREIKMKGTELFQFKPEVFKDDESALECDYRERCYSDEEDIIDKIAEMGIKNSKNV
ncbi:hypothetical protein CWI36_0256p0050 [Hamiltosporidium magnivora]|uniref:ZC3H15/TMA46 family C-terminal domain-containing protein n=1 Tax=Hamiltosporidium magnivora TaxID=148818 RepID=A0A4Q9LHH0_9MICR|nr:hypothetical protein CWI36_0256p0050 [Hamiltosporidium magnivora]